MAFSPLGGSYMVYYHNYYYILLRSVGLPAAALVCVVLYSGALGPLSASMDITGMIISWCDIGLRATYAPGFDRGWGYWII